MNEPPQPDPDGQAFDEALSASVYDVFPDILYAFDLDWQLRRWNDTLLERTGYSSDEIADMSPLEFVPEDERDRMRAIVEDVLTSGETRRTESELLTRDGERIPFEFNGSPMTDESGTVVGLAGVGRDISARKQREQELRQYETLFETIDDGVFVLDEDMRFVDVNQAFASLTGYERDELTGENVSMVSRDADLDAAVRLSDEIRDGDREVASLESRLVTADGDLVPLETHFSLLPSDAEFEGTVGVSRDVSERKARERELRQRRDQLETLNRINVVIRELVRSLAATASREEIEETVCTHLADSDLYQFAWVGARTLDADDVSVRAEAGEDVGTREIIGDAADSEGWERPASVALRTGEIQAVNDATVDADMSVTVERFTRDLPVESGIAVPLSFGETTFGVLVVYATRTDAFGERERAGFAALGDLVAFAINAVESRRLLFADTVVELEFRLTDPEALFVGLSEDLDCECRLQDAIPAEDETMLCYVEVIGSSPDAVFDVLDDADAADNARIVDSGDDVALIEFRITGASPIVMLAGHGASITRAVADAGEGHVVAELAPDADVRSIVQSLQSTFPAMELVGKRDVERPAGTVHEFRTALDDTLTDRQLVTLRAAYRAGYFDWPRASTAEEVAEGLDISSATLHQHLRKAQKKILEAFFAS